jgi:quinol-cytochrome oxidoreductase complex cytochrome b subunit
MPVSKFQGITNYPLSKIFFWVLVRVFFLLTWIGACPVEAPYVFLGQVLSIAYFFYFFSFGYLKVFWDELF